MKVRSESYLEFVKRQSYKVNIGIAESPSRSQNQKDMQWKSAAVGAQKEYCFYHGLTYIIHR